MELLKHKEPLKEFPCDQSLENEERIVSDMQFVLEKNRMSLKHCK